MLTCVSPWAGERGCQEEGVRSLVPILLLKLSKIMLEITRMGLHEVFLCRTNF